MVVYDVAETPHPHVCYLCRERYDLVGGPRPTHKTAPTESEVYLGSGPQSDSETYRGVCSDCADDLWFSAQEMGVEFVLIGYVP